jgi:nucleoside 2-deoxyribosyltransferase
MKIYFAGSIRGGRDDKEFYAEIIKKLSVHGTVTTEHVGDQKLTSDGETHLSNHDIYTRDIAWLTGSDAVVAEVTTASLGVGFEIGLAEHLKKKTLCLYRAGENKKLSAVIAGNPRLVVKTYENIGDLDKIFAEFF